MKTITRFALTTVAALTLVSTVSAASNTATATANANARIISPITLVKNIDLNFGDVIPSIAVGTVVVDPAGARTFAGGVTLGSATGVAAASFTVGGQASATYAITLPAAAITIINGGGGSMTVGAFTSSPAVTGALSGLGAQTLTVGGTLNVGASQATGSYTGTFNVTVTYN
jgi:Domain of unknown function (DUF4402)